MTYYHNDKKTTICFNVLLLGFLIFCIVIAIIEKG